MEPRPVKTQRAKHEPSPPAQPEPIDVALDALAVFLDTTTTTKQRTDAAKAVTAARERRARDRPGTP